jgi:Nuclear transport factor 2 (NTF2) domain
VTDVKSLPFQKVAHRVSTLDAQPNGFGNGAIVMVTGELLVRNSSVIAANVEIDEETNPQRFSQTFHLVQDGDAFFVINDVFRLNYS